MRAKPYITCGLLAGALTLPVSAFALGLGKLTVQSGPRAAACRRRSSSRLRKRTNSIPCAQESPIRRCIATTTFSIHRRCRARASSSNRAANSAPYLAGNDFAGGQRRLPRSPGRAQLGHRPRRARLHVPARSAEQHRNAGGRACGADSRPGRCRQRRPTTAHARSTRRAAAAPGEARPPPGRATRSSAAIRCPRSPSRRSPTTSASSRCWSRCSAATRARSTSAT